MLGLPILTAEARIASRRSSTYGARAAYGCLLLGLFGLFHQYHEDWSIGRPVASKELVRFASAAFEWMAVGQAVIMMALVPAIVAGSIAEERSRRTLEGLLASRFSGAAIILDKLAAKLFQLGMFQVVGLPIVCLLGLLGGIDPLSVAYAYAGMASTAFFLAGFSLLVSVYARTPRGAILLVYLIQAVWLVVPWFVYVAMLGGGRRWLGVFASVNDSILATSPLSLVTPATISGWTGQGPIAWFLGWLRMIGPGAMVRGWTGPAALSAALERMITWQLAWGALFLACASWRLRPVARRLADAPRRGTVPDWLRGRPRTRPACGDDPMLWKERYSRDGGAGQFVLAFGMLAFGLLTLLYYEAFLHRYRPALDEFFAYGYAGRLKHSDFFAREVFLSDLLRYSVLFYVAALVAVAVRSATGVTHERDARTWDAVLNSRLEPAEIVRAKVLGALTRQRLLLALILAPWLFGLVLGALHPIGLLLAVTGLAVFLYFASALGTLCSIRSRTSGGALVRTLGVLLALNLGSVSVGLLLMGSAEFGALFGCTVVLLYYLPVSNNFMPVILAHPGKGALFLGVLTAYVAAYAILSWVLCRIATRGFDPSADRPVLDRS